MSHHVVGHTAINAAIAGSILIQAASNMGRGIGQVLAARADARAADSIRSATVRAATVQRLRAALAERDGELTELEDAMLAVQAMLRARGVISRPAVLRVDTAALARRRAERAMMSEADRLMRDLVERDEEIVRAEVALIQAKRELSLLRAA